MRKRYRIILLAALVAALVVPVGFALSLESTDSSPAAHPSYATVATQTVATVPAAPTFSYSIPDEAKLFLVGTILFGLASAVRRAT
jgi:hypothetical protein